MTDSTRPAYDGMPESATDNQIREGKSVKQNHSCSSCGYSARQLEAVRALGTTGGGFSSEGKIMSVSRLHKEPETRPCSSIVLESRFLRVQILPELGARLWQIVYKPTGADLLWNNPQIEPSRHELGAAYDEVWSGGWDELFPNDEAAIIAGKPSPDHGELWTGEFEVAALGAQSAHLQFSTPVSSVFVEKSITLSSDRARLHIRYRFTNRGLSSLPFLWKLHPAFKVSPAHRIDFPAMQVDLEPDYLGTLHDAPRHFEWPCVQVNGRLVDLRKVPPRETRQLYFFYGYGIKEGWCALTDTSAGLACGLQFDPAVFPSCWLFASYGGWNSYNVAVLEPCTGYPLHFDEMMRANRHRTLEPGRSFQTDVLFAVQEGLNSVGGFRANGTMKEAAPD